MRVGVVGASGAVGREVLAVLEQRRFPVTSLRVFCSPRSAGGPVAVGGASAKLEELSQGEKFRELDVVFFTAGGAVSERFAPRAAASGALVIDNSSVFRMRPEVPLVVPEVNASALGLAREKRLVANPNCTTVILVLALKPLHDRFRVLRVVVSSYQAVSGKGQKGIEELQRQLEDRARGRTPQPLAFAHPIALNCLPHIDTFQPDGFTGEEHKVMAETRKILGDDSIRVVATCVRVPVLNCHSESVCVETARPVASEEARRVLAAMPGVRVADDPGSNLYPLAMEVSGKDEVFVGRVRSDPSLPAGAHGLAFWAVGDNLRKGAALNAVQIAEAAIRAGMLPSS